jgi:Amt family ammonium transporter
LFDVARGRKLSALGFCIGAVVGLVAITPASGFVTVPVSIFIGIVAGATSNFFAHIRSKSRIDDTLDVFPCHGIGGMVGMIMTGIFASKAVNSAAVDGLAYGGVHLFTTHMLALVLVSAFAFCGSFALLKLTDLIIPLRVSAEEEMLGLDVSQHEEQLFASAQATAA